jgi:hypothetical protein
VPAADLLPWDETLLGRLARHGLRDFLPAVLASLTTAALQAGRPAREHDTSCRKLRPAALRIKGPAESGSDTRPDWFDRRSAPVKTNAHNWQLRAAWTARSGISCEARNRRSVSEARHFLCHALYSAELAACREISAVLYFLGWCWLRTVAAQIRPIYACWVPLQAQIPFCHAGVANPGGGRPGACELAGHLDCNRLRWRG